MSHRGGEGSHQKERQRKERNKFLGGHGRFPMRLCWSVGCGSSRRGEVVCKFLNAFLLVSR
jgi:hypothetical protein